MAVKNIVVSVASEDGGISTVKYAIYLARLLSSKLTAIYVVNESVLNELLVRKIFIEAEAHSYARDLEERSRRLLERVKEMAHSKGVECETILLKGAVHEEIISHTRTMKADMLVMGELKEVLSLKEIFYDEGERIFREAPCPVVVVKNAAEVERLYKEL